MLNFLFIFLLIIIITPYILRWLAPFMMKYFINRMQKNMQNNGFQGNNATEDQTSTPKQETKSPNKAKEELGDYVDFEEIKED